MNKNLLKKIEKILTHEVLSENDRALYDILIFTQHSVGICEETVSWLADILRIEAVVIWSYIAKNTLLEHMDGKGIVSVCAGLTCSYCPKAQNKSWEGDKQDGSVVRSFSCLGLCFEAPVVLENGYRAKR